MVRLMHKKYTRFLMMKHSVFLFINLASIFYKNSIYTVYRAIHQLFVFPYKLTYPKNGTTTSEKLTRKKSQHTKETQKKPKQNKTKTQPNKKPYKRQLILNMLGFSHKTKSP